MSHATFLNLHQTGKTSIPRTLLALFVILFFWLVLGSLLPFFLTLFVMNDGNPATLLDVQSGQFLGIPRLLNFAILNLGFWFLIAGLFVAVRWVHERPFRTLITPHPRLNWWRIAISFSVYLLLVAFATLVEFRLNPSIYQYTFEPSRFWPFLAVILLLTPIQTSAEELLFRGYLLQVTGQLTHNVWLLAALNGAIFMLPHLANPEVGSGPILLALFYLGFGFFLALLTLRSGGLEVALGVHAANNVFTAVFANYVNSALETSPIFTVTELDPVFSLIAFTVGATLFTLLFWRLIPVSPN